MSKINFCFILTFFLVNSSVKGEIFYLINESKYIKEIPLKINLNDSLINNLILTKDTFKLEFFNLEYLSELVIDINGSYNSKLKFYINGNSESIYLNFKNNSLNDLYVYPGNTFYSSLLDLKKEVNLKMKFINSPDSNLSQDKKSDSFNTLNNLNNDFTYYIAKKFFKNPSSLSLIYNLSNYKYSVDSIFNYISFIPEQFKKYEEYNIIQNYISTIRDTLIDYKKISLLDLDFKQDTLKQVKKDNLVIFTIPGCIPCHTLANKINNSYFKSKYNIVFIYIDNDPIKWKKIAQLKYKFASNYFLDIDKQYEIKNQLKVEHYPFMVYLNSNFIVLKRNILFENL